MKLSEIIKQQTKLVEIFLTEYCKVNSVQEKELESMLRLIVLFDNLSTIVVAADDARDVKFSVGFKSKVENKKFQSSFEVSGEVSPECYPETYSYVEQLNNSLR